MKKAFLFFLTAAFAANIFAQQTPTPTPPRTSNNIPQQSFDFSRYGVRIEPDRRLIVVMAALEAAGLETVLSKQGAEFRTRLRSDISTLNPNTKQKLQAFMAQYKRRNPNQSAPELAAPFVSLGYALSPVPDLQDPPRTTDLPANLLEVFDFAPLVREFYRQSNFGANLEEYYKIYQTEGDKMRLAAANMILSLSDYLHTKPQTTYIEKIKTESKSAKGKKTLEKTETRERERRFFIVPDLLAPVGTINFRNVGDDYYVVVPPNTNLTVSEARRAFLQFVLDPLILQNAKDINGFRDGIRSLIEERRKQNSEISTDIFLAVSRSIVAAADARQIEYAKSTIATIDARRRIDSAKGDDAKRAVSAELARFKTELADETALELSEAYERGAVLAFFFAEQLKGTEESGFDISGAFRDMILSLDVTKETGRLAQFSEARKRAIAARENRRKNSVEVVAVEMSPREKALRDKLLQIEEIIKVKNYEKAETELSNLMNDYPGDARIFYARGRVASLWATTAFDESARDRHLGRAAANYRNVILQSNAETDPVLVLRSHVALGRILEFNDQNEDALKEFDAAIKIGEVDKQAYQEAVAGRDRLTKKP